MPATLIASRSNPRVKQLRAAFAGRARLSGGLIAIEGENMIHEAMRSGIALETVFLSQRGSAPAWLPASAELIELSDDAFASAADTQTPQGIAALIVPPAWTLDQALAAGASGPPPLVLIAAGLQDPGNLGTLVRSAEAFAATAVLTTPGTVSQWNQKALRASAGSVFRVPVVAIAAAEVAGIKARGLRLLAAVAGSSSGPPAVPVESVDLTEACGLMIGNEGAGLSAELVTLADARISIPMPGPVESLNAAVAGSLLLYEASRQRQSASNLKPRAQHVSF